MDSVELKERQKAERLEKLRLAKERAGSRVSSGAVASVPAATQADAAGASAFGHGLAYALYVAEGRGNAQRAAVFEEFLRDRRASEIAGFMQAAAAYQSEERMDARVAMARQLWQTYICASPSGGGDGDTQWDAPVAASNTLNLPFDVRNTIQEGLSTASPRLFDRAIEEMVTLIGTNGLDAAFDAYERERARAGAGAFRALQVELLAKVLAHLPLCTTLRLRRVSRFFRDQIGSASHWQQRARMDGIECRALSAVHYVHGRASCTSWAPVDCAQIEVADATEFRLLGGSVGAPVLVQTRLPLLPLCFEPATYYFEFSAHGADDMQGRIGVACRESSEVFGVGFQGAAFSQQAHPSDISPL